MSDTFRVEGGHRLSGELTPQGAKNEALQILCTVLLTDEAVVINNVPEISDVMKLISLLDGLGVKVEKLKPHTYRFQADDINLEYLQSGDFLRNASKIRGSVMLIGPLLARFGKAFLPKPGGDKIVRRRLGTHFLGLEKLGAVFTYNDENYSFTIEAKALKGTFILMDEISVTGTANIVMAAVMAEGETQIYNAACEPYLQQLCKLLVSM